MRSADAKNGKKTGDGTDAGLFLPLPDAVASKLPAINGDSSPHHITFLYGGEVPSEKRALFLETVDQVLFEGLRRPFLCHIGEVDYFVNDDRESRVAVMPVRFDADLSRVRDMLWSRLGDAGFEVQDAWPVYRPHVTLRYMDDLTTEYDGPVPEPQTWLQDTIEVWGLPRVHEVKLGGKQALVRRIAKTFEIEVGQPVWYGKYKNKRGVVKEFKSGEKGDVLVVVQPVPKGRKQDKDLKLFKIRPRKVEKESRTHVGSPVLPPYASEVDAKGKPLHPGDFVSFPTYPRGQARGWVVISPRALAYWKDADGKQHTVPALAVVTDDGTRYDMTGKVVKLRRQEPMPRSLRVAAQYNLRRLIQQFLREEPGLDPSCSLSVKGKCDGVSSRLYHWLADRGIESRVVSATGLVPPLGDKAHPDWKAFVGDEYTNQVYLSHVVVVVGGKVVDLTAAQFGLSSGVVIEPLFSFKGRWQKIKPFKAWGRRAARYKSKKKVKTKGGDETTVYEYSDRQVAYRNREKAKRIEKLRGSIDKLRSQVKKDLKSDDEKTRNTALVVGLIDHTYERVGNEDSAKDGHFGVTGWRKKHIKVRDGKATVEYIGKSGVKQKKVVTDKTLVSAIKESLEGKGPEDLLCNGDDCQVDAADVNEYLKPFDVTAKDLRGFHANLEMQTRLRAHRNRGGKLPEDKKKREKKLKEEFADALEETAGAVGHGADTLRSQYLVPGLEDEFLKSGEISEKMDKRAARQRSHLAADDEPRYKYPRTPHLPWSPGATSDDRILTTTAHFEGKRVVVTEKMDGENCTIGRNYTHARSPDSKRHPSRSWVKGLQSQIGHELPDGWRLCGENLFAKHTIGYDELPSYFLLFSIWDERNRCLPWRDTVEYAKMLGVKTVPVLYEGPWDEEKIANLFDAKSKHGGEAEGYVVRVADGFPYSKFAQNIAKFVRKEFHDDLDARAESEGHWMQQVVKPNKLIKQATKSESKKDDEQIQKLIKPTPKKKPPRHDLRKERVEDEDRDVETQGAEKDRDLSLNYKRIARVAGGWVRRLADAGNVPLRPGEVRKTDKGFRAKNPKGDAESFGPGEKDKAKAFADGGDARQEDAEAEAKAKGEKKRDRVRRQVMKSVKNMQDQFEALQEDPNVPDYVKVDFPTGGVAARSYRSRLRELMRSASDGMSPGQVRDAAKALDKPFSGFKGALKADKGQQLADYVFAKRVLLDPSLLGGSPLSSTQLGPDELTSRSKEAMEQYRHLPIKHVNSAAQNAADRLRDMDPKSPEAQELNRIVDGMVLAAALQGESLMAEGPDGKPLRPPTSSAYQTLVREASLSGALDSFLVPGDEIFSVDGRKAVRGVMETMDDDDLVKVVADTPFSSLGELLIDPGTSESDKRFLRDLLIDLADDSMTTAHSILVQSATDKEHPPSPEKTEKKVKELKKKVSESKKLMEAQKAFQDCIADSKRGLGSDECSELAESIKKIQLAVTQEVALEHNPDMGANAEVAKTKAILNKGEETSLLDDPDVVFRSGEG